MAKWYRCNPYLGCRYEIPEKKALRLINSKWWTAVWDDYYEKFSPNVFYNIRDIQRDWIFKVDDEKNT